MSSDKRWSVNHSRIMDDLESVRYTDSQAIAIKGLKEWYRTWSDRHNQKEPAILTALAGRGKSFLVSKLILEIILSKGIQYKDQFIVYFVAPTHRVKVVLREFSNATELWRVCLPKFNTVHSLGGMRAGQIDDQGYMDEDWVTDTDIRADLIVVDEYPMISRSLYEKILPFIQKFPTLFLGDLCQLAAIEDSRSEHEVIPGHSIINELHPHNVFELTESMRCQGSVLGYCDQILDQYGKPYNYHNGRVTLPTDNLLDDRLSVMTDRETLISKLPDLLRSFDVLGGLYNFKVLCYTNDQVQYWNRLIRRILYPEDSNRFYESDLMLVRSPIYELVYDALTGKEKYVRLFHTNESFSPKAVKDGVKIDFVDRKNGKFIPGLDFQIVTVESYGKDVELKIPSPTSFVHICNYGKSRLEQIAAISSARDRRVAYNSLVDVLKIYGVAYKNDPDGSNPFKLQIVPYYAATLHATQGSTIKNVMLDWENMHRATANANSLMTKDEATIDLRRRLAYVASSRGKESLTIV